MFWKKKTEEAGSKPKVGNIYISDAYIYLANIIKIFIEDYGFKKACELGVPADKNGEALPLYTYPAIEYLNNFDFSDKKIFEFGSGNSTLYWLKKGAEVVSVENNLEWKNKLENQLKNYSKHQYLIKNGDEYVNSILDFEDFSFDLIIIDGAENRNLCAKNVIKKVKKDGMVILDNSDWYPKTAQFLKSELNFIQVDFYGFRPSKHNTSVTSLFLGREFDPKILGNRQPNFALGGFEQISSKDS